jgi:hypothetical protein
MKTDTETRVTVVFNQVEEFIAELEKDAKKIERGIVRRTQLFESAKISPILQHVSVFASYTVEGQLITLKRYCGDIWGQVGDNGPEQERNDRVIVKAEGYLKTIEEACKRLNLEVRAGAIQGDRRKCGVELG